MTAQTTTRPAASGPRIAPLLVVIIAILAFAGGVAVAQVIRGETSAQAAAPAVNAAVSPEQVSAPAPDVSRGFVPTTSQEYTTLSGWTTVTNRDDGPARRAGRHR